MMPEVNITKLIPAPRASVFNAWLDAKSLSQFIMPCTPGMTLPKVECDGKLGGAFLIVMRSGDKDIEHRGEYKTVEPYDKIAFTWLSMYTIPGSLVTLTFKDGPSGTTEMTLHQVGFPSASSCENHQRVWSMIIDQLSGVLS
jgi:uncharacterized protein YndB with AHSA1/START domain